MKPTDRQTLSALLFCLTPWLAVLVAIKLICEAMR